MGEVKSMKKNLFKERSCRSLGVIELLTADQAGKRVTVIASPITR
jgi:hypothetical protein